MLDVVSNGSSVFQNQSCRVPRVKRVISRRKVGIVKLPVSRSGFGDQCFKSRPRALLKLDAALEER